MLKTVFLSLFALIAFALPSKACPVAFAQPVAICAAPVQLAQSVTVCAAPVQLAQPVYVMPVGFARVHSFNSINVGRHHRAVTKTRSVQRAR